MSFGLSSSGFEKKKLADIKLTMEEGVKALFGVANVAPASVFGQFIGVVSEQIAELWDAAEDAYLSAYPSTAEGVPLDNAVDLTGIARLPATASFVTAILNGTEGTTVPAGTQFTQENTEKIFESAVELEITRESVLKAVIEIYQTGILTYTVQINGVPTTVNTASTDPNTILVLLQAALAAAHTGYTFDVDSDAENMTITVDDQATAFEVNATTNILIAERWTPVTVEAMETGATPIPSNSISGIRTPVSGLEAVDNLAAGTEGRDIETDDALRLRRRQSLRVIGAASAPAMEARILQEVPGVLSAVVIENATAATDIVGRPPHSFEVVVSGGDDQAIADKIWSVKAAGIATHSANTPPIEIMVADSQGINHVVRFSRPVIRFVHMNIEIGLYSEETFPTGGEDAIAAAIVAFGELLEAGTDLIRQRFYGSIFSIPGVGEVSKFEMAVTGVDEAVASKQYGQATATAAGKLIDTNSSSFIANGVVSGMVVKNTTDNTFTTVVSVDSEDQLTLEDDIFVSGEGYQVGVWGEINIPLAANEIGDFSATRITVTVV